MSVYYYVMNAYMYLKSIVESCIPIAVFTSMYAFLLEFNKLIEVPLQPQVKSDLSI